MLSYPFFQTLLADVNQITSDGEWNNDDKIALESQLVLATSEPLCLDPNPKIGVMSIKKQYHRQLLNTNRIRRHAKKYSQVAINRKRKTDQFTKHVGLHLSEFMSRYRSKPTQFQLKKSGVVNFSLPIKPQYVRPVRPPSLDFPESLSATPTLEVNVEKYVHVYDRPKENRDCVPLLLEEYILETDRFDGRLYHIKLSIFHRPSNLEYLGELYVDHNYKEGEKNGEACQFSLGTQAQANRYVTQFTDIFTEEGRKPVKIIHVVPGKEPTVTCTVGLREQNVSMQKKLQQQQAQQAQSQQQQQQQTPQTTTATQTSTATGSQIQISTGTQSQTPTGTVQQIQTLQQSQQLPPASSPSPSQQTQQQHLKAIINNNSFNNNNNNSNSNTNVCNNNNQIVIAGPSIMQPHLYTQQQTSTITTTSTNFTITTSTAATCTFSPTTSNTIILSPSPKVTSTPTTSINTPIINNKCDNNNSSISNTNLTKQLNLCSNGSLVLVQQTTDTNTNATANSNQNNNNNQSNTILVTTTNVTPTQPNQIQLPNRTTNLSATVPLLVSSFELILSIDDNFFIYFSFITASSTFIRNNNTTVYTINHNYGIIK